MLYLVEMIAAEVSDEPGHLFGHSEEKKQKTLLVWVGRPPGIALLASLHLGRVLMWYGTMLEAPKTSFSH